MMSNSRIALLAIPALLIATALSSLSSGQDGAPATTDPPAQGTAAAAAPQGVQRADARSAPPRGAQHLVAPGENWGNVLSKASPGDQILLMPGEHRAITIDGAAGSAEAPIIVRPLVEGEPVVINADRYGIRLRRVSHVVFQDLIIRGATLRGFTISAADQTPGSILDDNAGAPMLDWAKVEPANIVLRNVRIEQTGPIGQRPAVMIEHVSGVEIDNCTFHGWGGAAVEIIGSHQVDIHDSTFMPMEDHSQLHGVSVRGASMNIKVRNCRFEGVQESVFQLGGGNKATEFAAPVDSAAPSDELFEAMNVVIERNVVVDSHTTFGLTSASEAQLRHNTILRPRGHVVKLSNPAQSGLPIRHPQNVTLGFNLITWEPGDLTGYTSIDAGFPDESVIMGRNLWWSTETDDQRKALEPFPGPVVNPQVTRVDPLLNDDLRPNHKEARVFGHQAR